MAFFILILKIRLLNSKAINKIRILKLIVKNNNNNNNNSDNIKSRKKLTKFKKIPKNNIIKTRPSFLILITKVFNQL